jgi:hypothetical protein
MMYNHYDEANNIISELEKINLLEQANWLKESLENGSTGTEIFMALRFYLDKIICDYDLSQDLKKRCIILRNKIHAQLENIK